jgi:hypothetical protein
VPEISVEAYEKINRWRDKLDQTAKLNKRNVYQRAVADLFLEAEHERNLGAVQAITDAIYFLGRDHTGLCDDDIQYIMDGAKAKAERPINGPTETAVEGISLENFYAYMPMHNYIYVATRERWPAASVNARLAPMPVLDGKGKQKLDDKGRPEFISASKWLDQNRPVAQMTWAPGEPLIIADRLISHGGWIHRPGEACLNVYHPPTIDSGNAAEAGPWLDHVRRVYPNDAEHIIAWLAHRVQWPAEKINHALVLGGKQGTGKDTLLEPIKRAVGPWNFIEVMPSHMLGRSTAFSKPWCCALTRPAISARSIATLGTTT